MGLAHVSKFKINYFHSDDVFIQISWVYRIVPITNSFRWCSRTFYFCCILWLMFEKKKKLEWKMNLIRIEKLWTDPNWNSRTWNIQTGTTTLLTTQSQLVSTYCTLYWHVLCTAAPQDIKKIGMEIVSNFSEDYKLIMHFYFLHLQLVFIY